ncbi:MAG: hypothetical protein HW390_1591 [Candidatus Brocadiaceae bacterium]|nr:hypothetical protein [Candidatus Brocadiaceae bacterium]
MVEGVSSRAAADSIEAVKMAIDAAKMEGAVVLKLINDRNKSSENAVNPPGVGTQVDVVA